MVKTAHRPVLSGLGTSKWMDTTMKKRPLESRAPFLGEVWESPLRNKSIVMDKEIQVCSQLHTPKTLQNFSVGERLGLTESVMVRWNDG